MGRGGAKFTEFVAKLKEIAVLGSVQSVIDYDTQVFIPPAGHEFRPRLMSSLAEIVHRKATDRRLLRLAAGLMKDAAAGRLAPLEAAVVRVAWRDLQRGRKMSAALVSELAETTASAHHVWAKARQEMDFEAFRPVLEKIVRLKRAEAEAVGYAGSPYDALLAVYEPGLTVAKTEAIFRPLAEFLAEFIRRLGAGDAPDPDLALIALPVTEQIDVCRAVAERLGLDLGAGRLDQSAHPFMSRLHPGDTRITTRYDQANLMSAVYGVIHETGHALYEMAQMVGWYGTAAGSPASHAMHESQSRLWENQVGRSRSFCRALCDSLASRWRDPAPIEEFYRAVNAVRPSLIRVEADEVTYNLHVILRFELERDLIEGRLEVKDLPAAWNAKIEQYLGIAVPHDGKGVLQDVHWSAGLFGYFPSYALGNLYAAQLFERMREEIPDLDARVGVGLFDRLRDWLQDRVWRHGATLLPDQLIEQATGALPSAEPFKRYLQQKYAEIYRLK